MKLIVFICGMGPVQKQQMSIPTHIDVNKNQVFDFECNGDLNVIKDQVPGTNGGFIKWYYDTGNFTYAAKYAWVEDPDTKDFVRRFQNVTNNDIWLLKR